MTEYVLKDIYSRLEALSKDAHSVACALDIGSDRTEAMALYTVLHRLLRRGAAEQMHDAINPLMPTEMNYPVDPDSWDDCQSIANIEHVDSALRELVDDSTGDNGVRVVQAILRAMGGKN